MTATQQPPALTIPVHDLDAGGKAVRLPLERAWMARALEGTEIRPGEAAGELDVRLSRSGTDVVVHGELRGELLVPCARCLEPARFAVREPITALAVPASSLKSLTGRARELSSEGEEGKAAADDVLAYDGDTLVLDELVRDELVLAVPMIPLCSEGCPGIRPGHQANPESENSNGEDTRRPSEEIIDPRLAPLLELSRQGRPGDPGAHAQPARKKKR
jgi:uncharacterized protein